MHNKIALWIKLFLLFQQAATRRAQIDEGEFHPRTHLQSAPNSRFLCSWAALDGKLTVVRRFDIVNPASPQDKSVEPTSPNSALYGISLAPTPLKHYSASDSFGKQHFLCHGLVIVYVSNSVFCYSDGCRTWLHWTFCNLDAFKG